MRLALLVRHRTAWIMGDRQTGSAHFEQDKWLQAMAQAKDNEAGNLDFLAGLIRGTQIQWNQSRSSRRAPQNRAFMRCAGAIASSDSGYWRAWNTGSKEHDNGGSA